MKSTIVTIVLLFVYWSCAGVIPCQREEIVLYATATCSFNWTYTLNNEDIWLSQLKFKNMTLALYVLNKTEVVNETYNQRYQLVGIGANETEFRLENITEDDEGLYDRYMITNTGVTYCKEWNLTVVNLPERNRNTTEDFPVSSGNPVTATSRQFSSFSPRGKTSTYQHHAATIPSERNVSGVIPCQREEMVLNANTNCSFRWTYTLNNENIWLSRLYFKDVTVASYVSMGVPNRPEVVEETYKQRYKLVSMTRDETECRLENITEDDVGLYGRYMSTNTGVTYCKEWNLTVVNLPERNRNTTVDFHVSSGTPVTATSRQFSSFSPRGKTSTSQQLSATTPSERNVSGQDSAKLITCGVIGTCLCLCLCLCIVCYIRKRRADETGIGKEPNLDSNPTQAQLINLPSNRNSGIFADSVVRK